MKGKYGSGNGCGEEFLLLMLDAAIVRRKEKERNGLT